MIECSRFTFCAPPKAGCRYMQQVAERYDIVTPHGNVHTPDRSYRKPALTVVRNPADWLRSYYQNILSPTHHEPVDYFLDLIPVDERREHRSERLEAFVEAYLSGPAGAIGRMFASYPHDHVWRIEDMPWPVAEWLGVESLPHFDRRETPDRLTLPHALRARIMDHEREFVERWRY